MTFRETIETLITLLKLANAADSDSAQAWQRSYDANGYDKDSLYANVHAALVSLTGGEFMDHYHDTGNVNFDYVMRNVDCS